MARYKTVILVALLAALSQPLAAQDLLPFTPNDDTKYYDFWVGEWHRVIDGNVDFNGTSFVVRRSVHPAAFIEEWRQIIDGKVLRAVALRAWDKTVSRWMYTWVSENGLYQVWDGRKMDEEWYIVREFDIKGDRYLSRQAWIPHGADHLTRISERSNDHGKTWQLRFREEYQRTSRPGP